MDQETKLVIAELAVGDTRRMDCPRCGRPKTFTVTKRKDGVVWNCYSTHCDNRGGTGVGGYRESLVHTRLMPEKPAFTPFTGQLEVLREYEKECLRHRAGFGQTHLDRSQARYAPVEDRIAFPIFRSNGTRRGLVLRSYADGDVRWKALTFMDSAEPHLSWYGFRADGDKVLVVEDIPSAVRAAEHFAGWTVAMCGGGVGPDAVRELRENAANIVWAFDPDATVTAIRHHRDYGLVFNTSTVLPLDRDLKDMDESELKEVLCALN